MVGSLTGLAGQLPAGALMDATQAKRGHLLGGLAALSVAAGLVVLWPVTPVIIGATIAVALFGALQASAVAALTMGLFAPHELARRLGRNAAFDHAGNACAAFAAALIGVVLTQREIFLLVPVFSLSAAIFLAGIRRGAIDHERARGGAASTPISVGSLLSNLRLVVFAVGIGLFHLSNAAMLPLVGQRLALAHVGYESIAISACIIGAQLVMLPVAMLCGRHADRIGRKPLLISAFAILALRGALNAHLDHPGWWLVVQLLDGIGAGLLSVLVPLQVADITRGSGRYNTSLATVGLLGGIGAALSNGLAGVVVVWAGYSAAFGLLSVVALAGLVLLWALLPETSSPQSNVTAVTGGNRCQRSCC